MERTLKMDGIGSMHRQFSYNATKIIHRTENNEEYAALEKSIAGDDV